MRDTIAVLLLLARLGDIGSTYLATPTLRLEANPLIRRAGWGFASATLLLALVPYVSVGLGIFVLVASLLACFSNFGGLWLVRSIGEDQFHDLLARHARRAPLIPALLSILVSGVSIAIVGALLLYAPGSRFYVSAGILCSAIVFTVYRTLAFLRFRRAATG